jgi:hypothetical protein
MRVRNINFNVIRALPPELHHKLYQRIRKCTGCHCKHPACIASQRKRATCCVEEPPSVPLNAVSYAGDLQRSTAMAHIGNKAPPTSSNLFYLLTVAAVLKYCQGRELRPHFQTFHTSFRPHLIVRSLPTVRVHYPSLNLHA